MPDIYYVYIPDPEIYEDDLYHPSTDDVIDSEYTHEVWSLDPVTVKCIGVIHGLYIKLSHIILISFNPFIRIMKN